MLSLIKTLRDKKRRIAIGIHTHALARRLDCDTETFIMATKQAMTLHNSIPATVKRSRDTIHIFENIVQWAETHMGLVKAQIPNKKTVQKTGGNL